MIYDMGEERSQPRLVLLAIGPPVGAGEDRLEVQTLAKAFGATQALRDGSSTAAGRGPRAGRRERLGQEHARQDPQRRAPRRTPADRVRRRRGPAAHAARRAGERASSRSSRRCSSPRRSRCSTTSGWASTACARNGVAAREARRARARCSTSCSAPLRLEHPGRGALALATARRAASCARCCASRGS